MRAATENTGIATAHAAGERLALLLSAAGEIVLGKPHELRLATACMIAGGHLLVDDLPGTGKTTLANTLAHLSGLSHRRVQFTADLLPTDIIGVSVYESAASAFRFHPGPIFAQVVLADEINRATAKTQSALLEAMEERQITSDGETHALPKPFFVIATRNPAEQIGVYPLPESQLDRFLMQISLGLPDAATERRLLASGDRRVALLEHEPVLDAATIRSLQHTAAAVRVSEALLDYVQALLAASRAPGLFRHGLSPRAGQGLLSAARAYALVEARGHVLPEDVQAVFPAVATHRLDAGAETAARVGEIVTTTPIP
ncbi:MAG: AAA family ATPase [Chromatiales bacterium]|nr:AAA family ATPase [Chromatiales bacterium]